jgi:hypothetical protein
MNLKNYLTKTINDKLTQLTKEKKQHEDALKELETTKTSSAAYIVTIFSAWAGEGEKKVRFEGKGNLAKVIEKAEKEFMVVNDRRDIQGEYLVELKLGKVEYSIPENYWLKYISDAKQ